MILHFQRLDCYQISFSACFHRHRQSRQIHGESCLQLGVVTIQVSEEIREQRRFSSRDILRIGSFIAERLSQTENHFRTDTKVIALKGSHQPEPQTGQ
jgi:hypothetical protein